MNGISNKVLIDPSLMLAENSLHRTLDLINMPNYSEIRFEFYYPQSLHKLIRRSERPDESWGIKYFVGNAYPSDPERVRMLLELNTSILRGFEINTEQRQRYAPFYDSLREEFPLLLETAYEDREISDKRRETADQDRGISDNRRETFDEDVINILFEEWVFLNESSWIVSRIKKPFTRFTAAGSASLQFGRRATDILIRKSLKKKDDELLSKVDKLRAIGKWIAVGGSSVAGIFANPVFATITPFIAGVFLLFDPDTQVIDKELL